MRKKKDVQALAPDALVTYWDHKQLGHPGHAVWTCTADARQRTLTIDWTADTFGLDARTERTTHPAVRSFAHGVREVRSPKYRLSWHTRVNGHQHGGVVYITPGGVLFARGGNGSAIGAPPGNVLNALRAALPPIADCFLVTEGRCGYQVPGTSRVYDFTHLLLLSPTGEVVYSDGLCNRKDENKRLRKIVKDYVDVALDRFYTSQPYPGRLLLDWALWWPQACADATVLWDEVHIHHHFRSVWAVPTATYHIGKNPMPVALEWLHTQLVQAAPETRRMLLTPQVQELLTARLCGALMEKLAEFVKPGE